MTDDRGSKRHRHAPPPELDDIMRVARVYMGKNPQQDEITITEDRRFRELFGCGPMVVVGIWTLLLDTDSVPTKGTLHHLFWTLLFLKNYGTDGIMKKLTGADPDTVRKWS